MADSRRKGSGFLKSTATFIKEKLQSSHPETSLRLVYPSCFFPVLLNGWKKFATLLPNNCLAETPQALSRGGLADSRRKGSEFLKSAGILIKRLQANSVFFEFEVTEVSLQSL
ncbi:hypothetical protein C6W19_16160 [Bacillus sp. RJGP41]|nr:hypothetical protein C6W19_16160 [Bacillus sp. RJGP41]